MAGRKTKLTPEIQARIVALVEGGNYLQTAAEAAGVHKATLFGWMKRGEAAKAGPYREFFDAIKKASAKAEADAVANVITAGRDPKNWQAAATFLERRFPARWSKRDRTRVDVHDWREAAKRDGHDPDALLATVVSTLEKAGLGTPAAPAPDMAAGDDLGEGAG